MTNTSILANNRIINRMLILAAAVLLQVSVFTAHPQDKIDDPFKYLSTIVGKVNSDPKSSWKANSNFDPNFLGRYLNNLHGQIKIEGEPALPTAQPILDVADTDIPESFDSREKWKYCRFLDEIRDEGNCRSSWAVATTSVFTDRLCIATEGQFNDPLSAEQLISCCKECTKGEGCTTGSDYYAWNYLKEHGVVTGGDYKSKEGCQPYSLEPCEHFVKGPLPSCSDLDPAVTPKCYVKCTNRYYNTSFEKDHHKVKDFYHVENDVKEIQKHILRDGPVVASFIVYNDFLTYQTGVYIKKNFSTRSLFTQRVKLIGWGIEEDYPYWLAQNSWNYDWGDNGLFKILRGDNMCGIEDGVTAGIPFTDEIHK